MSEADPSTPPGGTAIGGAVVALLVAAAHDRRTAAGATRTRVIRRTARPRRPTPDGSGDGVPARPVVR